MHYIIGRLNFIAWYLKSCMGSDLPATDEENLPVIVLNSPYWFILYQMEGSTRIGLYLPLACSASVIYLVHSLDDCRSLGKWIFSQIIHRTDSAVQLLRIGLQKDAVSNVFTSPVLHCVQPTECTKLAYNRTEFGQKRPFRARQSLVTVHFLQSMQ